MVPKTAMPSAPPSSRVVSLTAEATPALAIGTALMMLVVAGAAVIDIPAAMSTIASGEHRVRRVDLDGAEHGHAEHRRGRSRGPSSARCRGGRRWRRCAARAR